MRADAHDSAPDAARASVRAISVRVDSTDLDYAAAHALATAVAQNAAPEPMLIAWFEAKTGRAYPQAHECTGGKPGWRAYAESHGGDLEVSVNDGEFVFIFATGLVAPPAD